MELGIHGCEAPSRLYIDEGMVMGVTKNSLIKACVSSTRPCH